MNMPCRNSTSCVTAPNPVLGFSSETTDVLNVIGLGYGPLTPPPLGSTWNNPTAFVALDVPVSQPGDQETANLLAESAAFQQAASGWKQPNGFPVITYQSASQFVIETCPDGSQFTFGVISGLFSALTQREADGAALSYCQRQIALHKVCLFGEWSAVCLNSYSSLSITAQGMSLGISEENLWQLTSGVLPPGMSFNGGSLASESVSITGTPTTSGSYSFSVMVTTPQGDFMEKSFTINVVGIISTQIPSGQVQIAYNWQLSWAGFNDPSFSVDPSSEFPAGLTLSASGLISGRPTVSGDFSVLIDVTDSVADCQQEISFTIGDNPIYGLTPSVNAGDIEYFNNGASFPAGTYKVSYVEGAFIRSFQLSVSYFVNVNSVFHLYVFDSNLPGGYQQFPGPEAYYYTLNDIESAYNGQSYMFVHTGGPIGMGLQGGSASGQASTPLQFGLTRIS